MLNSLILIFDQILIKGKHFLNPLIKDQQVKLNVEIALQDSTINLE